MTIHRRHLCSVLSSLALIAAPCVKAQDEGQPWVGTWTAAAAHVDRGTNEPSAPTFSDVTARQYVQTSIGGGAVRLRYSNEYGTTPLTIANVRVGIPDTVGNILQGSDVAATFGGNTTITIPAGGRASSDPVHIAVAPQGYLAVSTYFSGTSPVNDLTTHVFSSQPNQFALGDQTASQAMAGASWFNQYFFLVGVDVQAADTIGAVAAIGASFTDGYESGQNRGWTNTVAGRLATSGIKVGVLNQGLAGADLLDDKDFYGPGVVTRFERDVLDQPGIRWAILGEFNDLTATNGDQLIAAVSSLIAHGHERNIRLICATFPPVHATGAVEATRLRYNDFMRSAQSGCDAVFDEDAVLRDPQNPNVPLPVYQRPVGADGTIDIHPTQAGYDALGNGLDLAIFSQPTPLPADQPSTDCVHGWTPSETVDAGAWTSSCDGRFGLTLQGDGNMVLYQAVTPLWTSGTQGLPVARGQMLPNGNFVLYDVAGRPLWATNTDGHPNSHLLLQNDGNLVIYDGDNQPIWNTGTQR